MAFEIDEDQVAAGFVANDFGICIAPDIPILHSLNLKILHLVSPSWQRNFYMAMLKDVYHPPVVEAFKKFVIEETSREIFYKTKMCIRDSLKTLQYGRMPYRRSETS